MIASSSTWFILAGTLTTMLLLIVVSFSVAYYLQYREQHPGPPGRPWSNSWAGYLGTLVFAISVVVLGLRLAFMEPAPAAPPPAPAEPAVTVSRTGWSACEGTDGLVRRIDVVPARATRTPPDSTVTRNIENHGPEGMFCSFERTGYARTDIYLRAGERFVFNQDLRNVRCSPDPLPSKSF
jgi:hypothetical protein